MIPSDQINNLMHFPEAKRKWQGVAEDLRRGRSVIWMFQDKFDMDLVCNMVIDECERYYGMSNKVISLEDTDLLPGTVIAQSCGKKTLPGKVEQAEELMDCEDLPDLIVITGLDKLSSNDLTLWAGFIRDWAQAAKTADAKGKLPKALLIPSRSTELLQKVQEDIFLTSHWFWGWTSGGELQLVARSISRERGLSYKESLWVETVFVELAGTDPMLLFWLLNQSEIGMPRMKIFSSLRQFAEKQGWEKSWVDKHKDALTSVSAGYYYNNGPVEAPPTELRSLWQAGLVDWHVEEGLAVHSAVLAVMGDEDKLDHRIWRGQARILFPILDSKRHEVCHYLQRGFKDWPAFCSKYNQSYHNSSFVEEKSVTPIAEFNEIVKFLKEQSQKFGRYRNLKRQINNLRKARNTLAHYVPLEWEHFSLIIDEMERMYEFIAV
ncbi:hypothetical protein [Calderihabitans maritimus]|uniref:Swt1-like HEPN domain-containing protein n=1 Tax=Calderihabitans maritimus TaxID=1246530 RepID=A0A1Z5HXW8_9FIRM|nr:hypothetical protein [Calderihabitans maritimus]GAW94362.1 hypothetical protein Sfum_0785 [Calderihabitans maritimus]